MYLTGKDINRDKKAFDAMNMGGAVGGVGGISGGIGGGGGGLGGDRVAVEALEAFAEMGGEEGTARGKGRGRGRKRKAADQLDGAGDHDDDERPSVMTKAANSDVG